MILQSDPWSLLMLPNRAYLPTYSHALLDVFGNFEAYQVFLLSVYNQKKKNNT